MLEASSSSSCRGGGALHTSRVHAHHTCMHACLRTVRTCCRVLGCPRCWFWTELEQGNTTEQAGACCALSRHDGASLTSLACWSAFALRVCDPQASMLSNAPTTAGCRSWALWSRGRWQRRAVIWRACSSFRAGQSADVSTLTSPVDKLLAAFWEVSCSSTLRPPLLHCPLCPLRDRPRSVRLLLGSWCL